MKTRYKDFNFLCKNFPGLLPTRHFFNLIVLMVASLFAFPAQANPPYCADIFSNGLLAHRSDGFVRFNYNSQLIDPSSTALTAPGVLTSPWAINKSCGAGHCTATGGTAQRLYGPIPRTTTATNSDHVPRHTKKTLGGNTNQFKEISVYEWGTGEFSSNYPEYLIETLRMSYKSTLRLPAGTYWIKTLQLEVDGKIDVLGEGTVNVFVTDDVMLPLNFRINEASKNPAKIGIYAYGNVNFYVGSKTYAFVHAEQWAVLHHKASVVGGVNASVVDLLTESQVRYDPVAAQALGIGSLCRPL